MSDIAKRIREFVEDAQFANGAVMIEWDRIRYQIEAIPGSDIPRRNFEALIDKFCSVLIDAVEEIERLKRRVYISACTGRNEFTK